MLGLAPKTDQRPCRGVRGRPVEEKIKARVQTDKKIYIHNDLSQGATYFNDVMVAFAFEANLNFMGNYLHKMGKIGSWEEKAKYYKKLDKVFGAIGIKVEKDKRPLRSMERMKALRDTSAHGKPVELKGDDEKDGTQEELRKSANLAADWEAKVKPEVVAEMVSDLDELWKLMIQKSGIPVYDTMTQGETSIIFTQKAK
jgi:hypothetical protein